MITVTQVLTFLIASGIASAVTNWWLTRFKSKQETTSLAVQDLRILIDEMRLEREDDRKQIEANRQAAVTAKAEAKLAQEQNDDCEFEHSITRLQLNKVLKKLDMMNWIKSTVFVLDDNEAVIRVFEHRFKTVPVVYFKAFVDADMCLKAAQIEKPEILVLDHMLSDNRTAPDIIRQLGYEPEIFIMSGTKDFEVIYKDTDVRFFYKDRYYIRNITKAIMEHLIIKNK